MILAFLFGENTLHFIVWNTLFFTLIACECSVFATVVFSSCFPYIFHSELVNLLNLYMISSLVFNEYLLRELFQISLLVLVESKKIHSYSGAKEACLDCA